MAFWTPTSKAFCRLGIRSTAIFPFSVSILKSFPSPLILINIIGSIFMEEKGPQTRAEIVFRAPDSTFNQLIFLLFHLPQAMTLQSGEGKSISRDALYSRPRSNFVRSRITFGWRGAEMSQTGMDNLFLLRTRRASSTSGMVRTCQPLSRNLEDVEDIQVHYDECVPISLKTIHSS